MGRGLLIAAGALALVACDGGDSGRSLDLDTGPTLPETRPSTTPFATVMPTTPAAPTTTAAVPTTPPSSTTTAPSTTSTTAAPTTIEPTTTTSSTAGRSFSVLLTGDLLSHIPVLNQALEYGGGNVHDWAPMFRAVQPIVAAADVAICHLETPVAPPGSAPDPLPPDYAMPVEIAAGIAAAGFDRCSLASNHVLDRGGPGVDATLAAFDAVGLGHAGMARSEVEARPTLFDVNGVTVAHLSFTFSFNGMPLPQGEPWRSNRLDPGRIVAEAQQARQDGADVVILSLHWGAEGVTEVIADQRRWAEEITASGAVDAIVGHHAHVVQPIEQVNGRWVVYGLGNFLSAMSASTDCCGIRGQDGLMVRLRFTEQADGSFITAPPEAIATYVDRADYVVLPVQLGVADPAFAGHVGAGALGDSLARTSSVVGPYLVPG